MIGKLLGHTCRLPPSAPVTSPKTRLTLTPCAAKQSEPQPPRDLKTDRDCRIPSTLQLDRRARLVEEHGSHARVGPAQSTGVIHKTVSPALAVAILPHLIVRRLPDMDIDIGLASGTIERNLGHRTGGTRPGDLGPTDTGQRSSIGSGCLRS